MKTIKKCLKFALCFMAFALCSFMFAFAPTVSAVSALNYTIDTLNGYTVRMNAIKIKSKIDASTEVFNIPLLTADADALVESDTAKYTVRVIDLAGKSHDYIVNGSADENKDAKGFFSFDSSTKKLTYLPIANTVGNQSYKVVYIVEKDSNKYYSKMHEVKVENVAEYELNFTETNGKKNLIPSIAKVGETITLPVAKAVSGSAVKDVIPVVRKNNVLLTAKSDSDEFTLEGDDYKLNLKDETTYTVEYSWDSNHKTFSIKTQTGDVDKILTETSSYSMPKVQLGQTDIELPKLEFKNANGEIITSDDYNVQITIQQVENSNIKKVLSYNNFKFDFTLFDGATSYEDMNNKTYNVIYNVTDKNGATCEKLVESPYVLKNVTTTASPSVYVSYDYEVNTNGTLKTDVEEINTDASIELKTKYGYSEINVPAIYGEDQVSKYEDLILIRYLVDTSDDEKVYAVDNCYYDTTTKEVVKFTKEQYKNGEIPSKYVFNFADDDNIGKPNKAVDFKFETDKEVQGTFRLDYVVVSKTIGPRTSTKLSSDYKFEVVADATYNPVNISTPTVDITNFNDEERVYAGDELKIEMTSSDTNDTKLRNAVFYFTAGDTTEANLKQAISQAMTAVQTADNSANVFENALFEKQMKDKGYTNFKVLTLEDGKYTTKLADEVTGTPTVVAVAVNEYKQVGVDVVSFEVCNFDNKAAEITVDDAGSLVDGTGTLVDSAKTFEQYETIQLPQVTFTDDDSNLTLSVFYYVESPETKTGIEYRYPNYNVSGNTIIGGELELKNVGTYFVGYSATDAAGNNTVTFFKFEVTGPEFATIKENISIDGEYEVNGNTYTIKPGTDVKFNSKLVDEEGNETDGVTFSFKQDETVKRVRILNSTNAYTFSGEGTCTVTLSGTNATSKTIYIVVEKPELAWIGEFNIKQYATYNEVVELPYITSTRGQVTVTVKGPSNSTLPTTQAVKEDFTDDGKQCYKFTTYVEDHIYGTGTYTVTYSVADGDDKLEDKVFYIKVGDSEGPTLTMTKETELKQNIVHDGTNAIEYAVVVNKNAKTIKIYATSNGQTLFSYDDIDLSITDRDSKNEIIDDYTWNRLTCELLNGSSSLSATTSTEDGATKYLYTIESTGTYTLKLTSKDSKGNDAFKDVEVEFKVVDKVEDKSDNGTVVGAVLIVVSLIVLAGLILFFTFFGKKGGKSKSNKKDKKETELNENDEENIVIEDNKDAE